MGFSRPASLRWFLSLVVLALTIPACKPREQTATTAEVATPSPSPTEAEGEEFGASLDIQRVSVFADGSARPEPVKVKKKTQIVVWALKGEGELTVSFPDSPFGDTPQQPVCAGRFCAVLYPPREGSEKPPTEGRVGRLYEYTVAIRTPTGTTQTDPHAEVVP